MHTGIKTRSRAKKRGDVAVQASSGNVFADLGLADADQRMAKAQLAQEICSLISAANLSQKEAARRLRIDQPKVSALLRGRLTDFSIERLFRFITAMDHDVVIAVRPAQDVHHGRVRMAEAS